MKPFQISAQMKGGPARTCVCVRARPPARTHTRVYAADTRPRVLSASVCCECLSSPCFWAPCQAQLPAVRGQGNTMAPNGAQHPRSMLYQLEEREREKKVVQRGQSGMHWILKRPIRAQHGQQVHAVTSVS